MAVFYYNGNGAQGSGEGSTDIDASGSLADAINALSGGNSVEVTAGTFTLTAAEADGKTITGAGNVAVSEIDATPAAILSGISVSGSRTGSIDHNVTFTGNLGSLSISVASGATLTSTVAILSAVPISGSGNVSVSDMATVAQATSLDSTIHTTLTFNAISDTSANLAGSGDALLSLAGTVTASDAATANQATTLAGLATPVVYSISDTAANLAGATAAALNEAVNLTATTSATVAQATMIVSATNSGTNSYNLSDTAQNLATAATAVGDGAGTITATTAATVAQATAIEAFTNSGANTYNISDSAANLAGSGDTLLSLAGTVTASDAATANQANTLAGLATPVVYSISDTAGNLAGATAAALNEAVNLTATTSATVAQATMIVGATNIGINNFAIRDTAVNLASSSSSILDSASAITVSGSIASAEDLNTANSIISVPLDASGLTSLTGTAAAVNVAYAAHGAGTITGLGNEDVSLSDTTLAASVLNTVDGYTSGTVNAAAVTTLTGAANEVIASYASSGISGLGDEAVTLSGSTSVADANSIDGTTSGVITATISEGDLATLASLTGTGNAYTITVTDSSAAASALTTLDDKTSVPVTATAVTTLIGTAAAVNAAYSANTAGTITGLGDEAVTLSDTTLAATLLNTVESKTSGTVNASNISSLTGLLADVNTAYTSATAGTISGLGDETVSITNSTGTLIATDLSTAGAATTGTVTISNPQTVTGTDAEVTAALVTAATKVVMGAPSSAIVSTAASAVTGAAIATSSNVTATFTAGISDTLANLASGGTATANLTSITADQGDVVIHINDAAGGTMTASDLSAVGHATTGAVAITNPQTINGSAEQIIAAVVTASSKVTANSDSTINASGYTNQDLSGVSSAFTLNVTTANGAVLDAAKLATADAITIAAGSASGTASEINTLGEDKITIATGTTLNVSAYTNQELTGFTKQGTAVLNVTTADGAVLDATNLADATAITIGAGSATIDAAATDEVALAAKTTVSNGTTLTVNNYVSTDLSGFTNQGSGSIVVNTTTGAVLDETKLADATSVVLGAAATAAASAIDGIGGNGNRINLNNQTLSVSGYTTEDLSGITSTGTLNVTTANGAVLDAAKLATADAITVVGTNSASAADADTLGSRLSGTATVNITTDPINANTDLSDLGSGLTLQFGGDSTVAVNGATLTVRQDQVSGYTISGSGTVAAAGTASADNFNAAGISATLNITSLAGSDNITVAPSDLGSADSIDGGGNTDTLSFSVAASGVVDVAFTNASSVEILQLANGTNSVTLGAEAEQAGITTVAGGSGADTLNLLYGTTGISFAAGAGTDTLSYSTDSGSQSITITGISSGTASGSVTNNGSDSFSGLEAIVGGSGSGDAITSTASGETVVITGANSGTIDGFSFSGVETMNLAGGNNSATINSGGSLSGNLSFGTGTDSLIYASYGSAVSVTLSTISSGSATTSGGGATGIGGVVSGVDSLVGSSASDTLTDGTGDSAAVISGANSGTLNSLGFSGFETLDLSGGNDSATIDSGASITSLAGGSGTDTLNLNSDDQTIVVTGTGAGTTVGTTGSTTSFSGFETINGLAGNEAFTLNSASGSTITLDGGSGTDSLSVASSDGNNNTLTISGSGSGSLGSVSFSGMESISLGSGADSASVGSGGSLSGNLHLGNGNNSLSFNGGAGAVGSVTAGTGNDSITLVGGSVTGAVDLSNGTNSLTISGTSASVGSYSGGSGSDTLTLSGGDVSGNVALGSGSNTLTLSSASSTIGGTVTFGAGTSDTLSYAGYGNSVTLSLNSPTSTAAAGASGISGSVSGFESLVGGSASDTLNAQSGANTVNVASDGTTTLDTSLTVSGFETINLGANSDASADTATISGAFSGTVDLGAGSDSATINNGGSVTSLAGGAGADTLNLDGAAQTVTITGSGVGTTSGTSSGSTSFSGFETINTLAGDDTITLTNAAATSETIDAGVGSDTLNVASSDTTDNSLTLSSAGGGTLGGVSFANVETINLGSGSDSVTLASGGGLAASQPGLLADFYNETGTGGIGSLLKSGVLLGPVNIQDTTLSATVGKSDNVYMYAQGYLTAPGSGSYNDFVVSTTSDDGIRVRLDLAGNGSYTTVINNYTIHGDTVNDSSPLSVVAGQRIPIQIEYYESAGGATLELYYQSASQGIARTLVPLSNLSSDQSSSSSGILDLGGGNDSVFVQAGTLGVGSIVGGVGNDSLDYSNFGSAVTVNLASGSATGTGGISGFETVLGSSAADTFTASTSGDVNLQGNGGNDTFNFTVVGLTSTDSVDGGSGADQLIFSDAGTISDAQFTNVNQVESLTLTGASTLSAGVEASQAGIATIVTGSGNTTINSTLDGYDLTVNAASLGDGAQLSLSGSASGNDFTVNSVTGSVLAGGMSGNLIITAGDAGDNAIDVTTGSGSTTITANGSGDTVTTNAGNLAQNTLLSLFGAAKQVVTNLIGNLTGSSLSGTLDVTTAEAADNGIDITTGTNNTTITASGSGDIVTVDADAMADNNTLDINGSSSFVVSNLEANIDAAGTSGAVSLAYTDVTDHVATITTGTGATTVSGSTSGDTLTINATSLAQNTTLSQSGAAQQVVTNLVGDINASGLTGSLTVTTGNAGDEGISITTGTNNTTITSSGSGDTVTVNAEAMADNKTLDINGSVTFAVTNLEANTDAAGTSGAVSLAYTDVTDNAATITTGTGPTTVSGTTNGDTLTVNAASLAQNTTLTQSGAAQQVVTNLVGDINASGLSGTLDISTSIPGDGGISVTTGSNNTTINTSAVTTSNGISFDGVNDSIALPKSVSGDFTIEYWLKTSQTSPTGSQWYNGRGIVDAEVGGASADFGTSLLNGKLAFGVGQPDTTIQSSSTINNGNWNHIAVTRNSSSGLMQIYVNGVLEASTNGPTGDRSALSQIAVGSLQTGINYIAGSVDELRLWNTVRSQAQIQTNASSEIAPQSGLVAYYKFNQGIASGSNAGLTALIDSSGNNNNGTLSNFGLSGDSSNWVSGTVNTAPAGNTLTVDATAMADNKSLTITGASDATVTNLQGNSTASASSGSLSINYANVDDNQASLATGSGNVLVSGGDVSDTVTVTGLSTNNQTFNAQTSNSNFNITAGANNQTLTGSNTGSDTIDGSSGTDTLNYAGGSAVTVTITDYSTQAGGSTGQGTDSFSNIESLVGSGGTDTLRGRSTTTDEVVTITGANSGTIRDSASSGTFSFSSFEQLDLQAGDDTLNITGNGSGVSLASSVDLGEGNNSLTMSGSAGSIASLSAGSGNDSFSISAGSITGGLSAGDGSNTLTLSGTSASVGSYSGGIGSDSITLSGGDVGGNVDLGSGINTLTLSSTSSTIGGNISFGAGTSDTLSYSGYSNTVSINLADITNNAGSTGTGGATAIGGTMSGFETVVGGSGSGDSLTDSSGDSTVAITGSNSGTIDGLAFSSIENLNLSTGNDTVTVTGSGGGVSLTGNLDLGDGTNSLTMSGSAGSIAAVSSGTGDDTISISTGSVIGAVSAGDGTNQTAISGTSSSIGSYIGGTGSDSVTLSGGDVVGGVSTGSGDDTVLISSTSSTIGGNLDLQGGSGDTLSYAGYSNAVSVTLTAISSNSGSTAAGGATAISGTASGFENLIGGSNTGDAITDSTGDSTVVISAANSGTIDGLSFSSIEILHLSSGIDDVTVTSGGSLSGSLNLGWGTSNTVQLQSGAGSIGALTAGVGNDTITLDGGSVNGAVTLGDGANSLTINNTNSLIGSYSGGSGVDTIVSMGGDINGPVNTGSAADSVTLSLGSTVSGNITLGADNTVADGADVLTLNASSITGNVTTGSGADSLSVLNKSSITGNITLGSNDDTSDGGDSLTVSGADSSNKSVITGSITTGGGADVLSFSNSMIGGTGQTLSLGTDNNSNDGGDSVTASNTAITAAVTLGSGSDTVSLSAGSSVTGNVTLGIDGDTTYGNTDSLTLNASSITGHVSTGSGADSVTVLNVSTITGNVTLGSNSDTSDGADTLTVTGASSSPSVITGSIATGAGADVISFTNATISGSGQTISLGSDNNSLDGNDTLSASATTITANISTGTGSDTLTLSAGSLLTGDVSLGSVGDSTTIADISNTITDSFGSLNGWTGGTLDSSSAYYGSFLGRYASGPKTNGQDVSKSFSLNGQPATISFDLIKLDSWDGESFRAYINDTPAFSRTFTTGSAISNSSGTTNGFSWTIAPKDSLAGHGFAGWVDQTATVTIALPAGYSTMKLGFGSTLDQPISDESYGIDNLSITPSYLSNDDSLTLNASGLSGNVTTGSGADTVSVLNASTITGNVTLGANTDTTDGADSLTVSGASSSNTSVITGSIATGGGADVLSFTDASIGSTGATLSLGSDNNSNDGGDSLTASNTVITASISTGSGSDTVSLSSGSSLTGDLSLGLNGDTSGGGSADTLTLNSSSISGTVTTGSGADSVSVLNQSSISGDVTLGADSDSSDGSDILTMTTGSSISGDIDLGQGNDLFNISTGISSPTSVTGTVDFGAGTGDTLSYSGNAGPITVALNSISNDPIGTATSAEASFITGDVSGFETIVGSSYSQPITNEGIGDSIYDNTGASVVILSNANSGTIDELDFSSIENLQLRSGADTLSLQGTVGAPGLIAGRADGGGLEGASYNNGVYSGGSTIDNSIDLLDYTQYLAGPVTVDLSQNKATGVFGDQAGGLISGDGTIATGTNDSSFENVDGSQFNDSITGDNQASDGNVLSGFAGNDTIDGLAGNDLIDGGNGFRDSRSNALVDGNDVIAAGDGADTILGSSGSDFISGGGISGSAASSSAVPDQSVDTLDYSVRQEGLDISITSTDAGIVNADTNASLTISSIFGTYNSSGDQSLSVPTNQQSTDWIDTFGDIQRLVLTNQNDILRLDQNSLITGDSGSVAQPSSFTVDAGGGALDTLDYSNFSDKPVYVNLSDDSFSFDFDANGVIDTSAGEIDLINPYSATNINTSSASLLASSSSSVTSGDPDAAAGGFVWSANAVGGANGVNSFEVVIGGAANDGIVGSDANNILVGNDGADRLAGLGGNDTIYGGRGDDYIIPGEGADLVIAGEGINAIQITSSDLAQDTFQVDPNGINIFKLNGDGSSSNSSSIDAPQGEWNPGAQGIDLLDGGDPVKSGGVTTYDTLYGTTNSDNYQLGGVALKNISEINLQDDNDHIGTSPASKGIKVSYDGGSGTDSVTLNLTFQQFARLNQSGLYVADIQNYIDNPNGRTFSSGQADFIAKNFETAGVAVVTPAVYNALQGDPAALTFNSSIGLQGVNTTTGADLSLAAKADASSTATARSVEDLVSAFVQANSVKGADAVTLSTGANLGGDSSAKQTASASSITVNDRSDSILSAYSLGIDRSTLTAGGDATLSLSGAVKADTLAEGVASVVNANGTAEAAGGRDTSLAGGAAVNANISGSLSQTVSASSTDGLAIAGLASRAYGIDDANLTDSSSDSVQAGRDLGLTVSATAANQVNARSIDSQSLGSITLLNSGSRFTLPASLWGASFPLINGDRLRFASTPTGGSLQANRDYFVLNVIPVTGEFQLSSSPAGDPIDVLLADNATSLEAFRPAVSTADAISTVTGVDLNRNAAGLVGLQAGNTLNLVAGASDTVNANASSVVGEATAGLNRLGSLDGLDTQLVSRVVALADTTSRAGEDASLRLSARDLVQLQATSSAGDALSEGNAQVLASSQSPTTAGADLSVQAAAALNQSASATSSSGSAEARSGAGSGAGSSTNPSATAVALGNVVPGGETYGRVAGLADGTQAAGAALTVNANASLDLAANSTTVGGSSTLGSLWTNSNNILSTFDPTDPSPSWIGPQLLAEGQRVQVATATAGLSANQDYVVRLIGSTAVNDATNRITVPTDITYNDGDAIRFRLNNNVAANSTPSRYGLELGTTYYVINSSANTFQLATAPAGAVLDLTADTSGAEDQLVDADRFQLLVPPAAPGDPYTVATLSGGTSGVSLVLPAASQAFAGSRQASVQQADNASLNLAELQGIDGSGLAANAGLLSLLSGNEAQVSALADGVLNAVARNTSGDAVASAGLEATGLRQAAIQAGSDGTVVGRATIAAVADAASSGDNALVDNSLATLNLAARGIDAAAAAQSIMLGADGVITADASITGRSAATIVKGDADALASLDATGLRATNQGFAVRIGEVGDLSASARLGSDSAPVLVTALSQALGDATAQAAAQVEGILGSYGAGSFPTIQAGAAQGDISASADVSLQTRASAIGGAASVTLSDSAGSGNTVVNGIRDMALTAGADFSRINASARGSFLQEAASVGSDASSLGRTSMNGIFSDAADSLPITLSKDGAVAALVNHSSFSKVASVAGNASSDLSMSSLGLGNASVIIGGTGDLSVAVLSRTISQAQSIKGHVSA